MTDIFVRHFDELTFSKFSEFSESVKSNLSNCTINWTVEQVIIRAYLLIFERVSLTSLSLRCDFLGVQRDFSRLRLDFNYVFSRSSLEVRLHFSTFKPIREGAAPFDQVLLQRLFCGSCFRRCRAPLSYRQAQSSGAAL